MKVKDYEIIKIQFNSLVLKIIIIMKISEIQFYLLVLLLFSYHFFLKI